MELQCPVCESNRINTDPFGSIIGVIGVDTNKIILGVVCNNCEASIIATFTLSSLTDVLVYDAIEDAMVPWKAAP